MNFRMPHKTQLSVTFVLVAIFNQMIYVYSLQAITHVITKYYPENTFPLLNVDNQA